jgi:parallel beta-helix repeat protein
MAFEIKAAGLLVIAIFVGSTLGVMMVTRPVYAPGTQPTCDGTITSSVKLTGNLDCTSTTDGIIIHTNGITLDCAGYTINGVSGTRVYGIWVYDANRVTVKNCKLTEWGAGIYVSGAVSSSRFTGNNVTGDTAVFFAIGYQIASTGTKNTFSDNIAKSNIYGFFFTSSTSGNTVSRNAANYNGYGFIDDSASTSTGSPYFDTLNKYRGNTCSGDTTASSPPDLCSAP